MLLFLLLFSCTAAELLCSVAVLSVAVVAALFLFETLMVVQLVVVLLMVVLLELPHAAVEISILVAAVVALLCLQTRLWSCYCWSLAVAAGLLWLLLVLLLVLLLLLPVLLFLLLVIVRVAFETHFIGAKYFKLGLCSAGLCVLHIVQICVRFAWMCASTALFRCQLFPKSGMGTGRLADVSPPDEHQGV